MEVYWVKTPRKGNKETCLLLVLVLGKSSSLVYLREDSTQRRTVENGFVISAAPTGSYFVPFPLPPPPSPSSSTSTCPPSLPHLPVLWIKFLTEKIPVLQFSLLFPQYSRSIYPCDPFLDVGVCCGGSELSVCLLLFKKRQVGCLSQWPSARLLYLFEILGPQNGRVLHSKTYWNYDFNILF